MYDCPIRSHNCLDPAINVSLLCQHKYVVILYYKKVYMPILSLNSFKNSQKLRPTEISWFKRTPIKFKKKDKNLESKGKSQWPIN